MCNTEKHYTKVWKKHKIMNNVKAIKEDLYILNIFFKKVSLLQIVFELKS